MFNFLLLPNNEIDSMTKQCLEIIFGGFVVVSKRMLADHLKGGKLELNSERLSHEASNVLATNADSERDFGMLDRLMKLKPKALDIVYEGIIMFNRNKTSIWRDNLSPLELKTVMAKARKLKCRQKELYFQRKKTIHETRVNRMKSNSDERERKARLLALEKERLVSQLEQYGGGCGMQLRSNPK